MYNITIDYTENEADKKVLLEGMITSTKNTLGHDHFLEKPLSIVLKDENNNVHGGILAHFDNTSLYIDIIWVEENSQKQGYGTKLLQIAENEAIKLGCQYSMLDTYSFQAEVFYLKNGYERIGEINNYYLHHSKIFFRKTLNPILKDNKAIPSSINPIIVAATEAEREFLDEKIVSYNAQKVPFTQKKSPIYLDYVIKNEDGNILAGITSVLYSWHCLYVDVLWVADPHRNKGYGGLLLSTVEEEAKQIGCTIVHLDTFDFQAKDFYLKKGYKVFGELIDCPPGHTRFYLKKNF